MRTSRPLFQTQQQGRSGSRPGSPKALHDPQHLPPGPSEFIKCLYQSCILNSLRGWYRLHSLLSHSSVGQNARSHSLVGSGLNPGPPAPHSYSQRPPVADGPVRTLSAGGGRAAAAAESSQGGSSPFSQGSPALGLSGPTPLDGRPQRVGVLHDRAAQRAEAWQPTTAFSSQGARAHLHPLPRGCLLQCRQHGDRLRVGIPSWLCPSVGDPLLPPRGLPFPRLCWEKVGPSHSPRAAFFPECTFQQLRAEQWRRETRV